MRKLTWRLLGKDEFLEGYKAKPNRRLSHSGHFVLIITAEIPDKYTGIYWKMLEGSHEKLGIYLHGLPDPSVEDKSE